METLHPPIYSPSSENLEKRAPVRIRFMSDLHIEFGLWLPKPVVSGQDVVVLAGDIHVRENAVRWAKMAFAEFDGPVLLIPGNHEYYGGALEYTLGKMREEAEGSNVHVLSRDTFTVRDVKFLGCTMWTDYRITGNQPLAMYDAQEMMSDFKRIKTPGFSKLRASHILTEHVQDRLWMEYQLKQPFDGKYVAVTHHVPSEQSLAPHYKGLQDHSNAAFVSDLSGVMMTGQKVSLWIHGHNHTQVDFTDEYTGTRVVSNQRGYYPDWLEPGFNENLVIDL